MEYRIVTYKSLIKDFNFIDLGDQVYGEWIIYEMGKPVFHVDCFRKNSASDSVIKSCIEDRKLSINEVLERINKKESRRFNLGKRPALEIIKKSSIQSLDLGPISIELLKNL